MSIRSARRLFPLVLLPFATAGLVTSAMAQQSPFFTPGNVVVAVEGCGVYGGTCTSVPNGTGTGTGNSSPGGYGDNQAAPLTLFQFAPVGTASASYVNSLVLPQTPSGANLALSGEYGSSSEGTLHNSTGGQYLTLGAYGINAATFDASPTTYGAAPSNALAQSGSLTGQSTTPVARVITLIDAYGNVNSSTALFNIYNTNNPRSVFTADGLTAYISGQGTGTDATGGVFYTPLFATNNAPTAITGLDAASSTTANVYSQDTRDVQIYNNTLYVSTDTKGGTNSTRSYLGSLGSPAPTSLYNSNAGPTELALANNAATPVLVTSNGKLTLTASEVNGINASGQQINISPSGYFFANPYTLYIADTGNSKQTSASSLYGDGGLQKWINTKQDGTGTWELMYTVASGLGLIANTNAVKANTSGSTGLYGLAGVVNGASVYLYATNATLSDLDPTYLYGFTDTLAATTNPGTSFVKLATAPSDSNFKGVAFAPTLPTGSATITTSPSGLSFTTAGSGCTPGTYVSPVTLLWTPGSRCTLTVANAQTAQGTQYVFSNWQDGTRNTSDSVSAPTTSAVYNATFTSTFQPVGNLDQAIDSTTGKTTIPQNDSLFLSGWAADPLDGAPLSNVKAYIDGNLIGTPTLGGARPDVAAAYSSAYTNSGFSLTYAPSSLSIGSHNVTVVAIDSTAKSTTFGPIAINVTTANTAPVGNLDEAVDATTASTTVHQSDNLFVSGWAADPTDGSRIPSLNVLIDGTIAGIASQGVSRPDVASATGNASYGSSGYNVSLSAAGLSLGTHSITVVAKGSNNLSTSFGPITITVVP